MVPFPHARLFHMQAIYVQKDFHYAAAPSYSKSVDCPSKHVRDQPRTPENAARNTCSRNGKTRYTHGLFRRVYARLIGLFPLSVPTQMQSLKTDRPISIHNSRFTSSCPSLIGHQSPSVSRSNRLILKIITNNPIVTIINSANPNHPSIIADVPTPLFTLPFPRSCAIVLAATDAVCCHSTETSTKTEATKMSARATWETGREGKGLTSRSEPRSSISSCQPGKVARRRKQTKARTMATMLKEAVRRC